MRACARCGQENPEGFRFCGACGAPLEESEAPREVRKTVTVVFCCAGERAQETDFWEYLGATSEARALVLGALGRGKEATAALESAVRIYREKGASVAEGRARGLLAEL